MAQYELGGLLLRSYSREQSKGVAGLSKIPSC